jgi:hypothetical protein
MTRYLAVAAVLAAGCSKHNDAQGLPPAQKWTDNASGTMQPGAQPANTHAGADPNNPHAGVDMTNPHAGVDMNNPHGEDMAGTDVGKLGLPPPDPNRPIDPAHHVKGTILVHAKAKDRTPDGGAVFVVVKKVDDAGQPAGPPLAVEKLTWKSDGIPFELTEANAMIAGTQLTGDVVIVARYDHDGDAISKQPGDVVGQVRLKIPADDVKLTLDQILP